MKAKIGVTLVLGVAILIAIVGCHSSSTTYPMGGTNQYSTDWFPLANNIATVWENVDYDSMGMPGTMYVDTSMASTRMMGSMMYYNYGVDIGERDMMPNDTICLMMRNDSIYARDFNAMSGMTEVLEGVLPPHTGTMWNGDWDNLPCMWSATGQTLSLTAGTFSNVAILQQGPTASDSSYKQFWFTQGVGIIQVKMWMDHPDSTHAHNVMPMHMMTLRKIMYP